MVVPRAEFRLQTRFYLSTIIWNRKEELKAEFFYREKESSVSVYINI